MRGSLKSKASRKKFTSEEELKFWKEYAELMTSKNGYIFLNLPLYKEELKAFEEFIDPKAGERWLDIGCGALPITELILRKSKGDVEIWAGDLFLSPAKKRLKEIGNPPIKLKYLDLTRKLPFPDKFFDGITAGKVLPYIPEFEGKRGKDALKGIFQEMLRILKPGGILIWSGAVKGMSRWMGVLIGLRYTGYVLNPYNWIKTRNILPFSIIRIIKFFKPMEEKGRNGIYPFLSQKEYEDLLILIGFKNPEWKITFGKQILVNKVKKPF
jgi:ubiquinone/menaquinone biosynthesis C-methylase UbiE